MSKVLFINGSPNQYGCTYTGMKEVADTLSKEGIDSEFLWLSKKPVQDCIACNFCVKNGRCVFNDVVNETAARLPEFAGIVIGSPVYYGGYSGNISSFLDRFCFSSGGPAGVLKGKVAAAVVSCRRGGATAAFDALNNYLLMCNTIVAGSQYWNMVHGFTPDDVKQDIEGLQTMRTLGRNMAWMIKCIEAGKKAGVADPVQEDWTPTHFIR